MNILIATISTFAFNAKEYTYNILVGGNTRGEITAVHTNESIVKSLSKLSIKIDKIVALCSYAVLNNRDDRFGNKTPLEYYSEKAVKEFPDIDIVKVDIQLGENTNRQNSEIINDVCQTINASDTVYLDIAGGQRTITNITQLLSKILQYKGIDNALSLYADIQNKIHYVTDTSEFATLSNIADAINEFVTTGKSTQLNSCLKKRPEFKDLLSVMNDFSERIMLCDIGKLDGTLLALKHAIKNLSSSNWVSSVEQTVVMQLLPVIKDKLLVESESFDYKQIIKWCLDNGLIQQAVTIYIEKMPVYYFQKRLLNKYVGLDNVKPTLGYSKETAGFYEELFNKLSGTSTDELTSEFQIFVKNTFYADKPLPVKWVCKSSDRIREACVRLANFINKNYRCISYKKDQLYNTTAPKELHSFIKQLQSNSEYHHFFVYNDINKWEKRSNNAQGKRDTYTKKVKALQIIKNDNLQLHAIMSHYLALKIMRNRMNHASEEVLTDDEQIAVKYLKSVGFNIDFSISAITKIIENGLKIV